MQCKIHNLFSVLFILILAIILSCNTEQKKYEYKPVFDLTDVEGNPLDIPCSNPLEPNTYKHPAPSDWPTIRDMKMGAYPESGGVTFRVFAPTAQTVELVTYDSAAQNVFTPSAVYAMTRDNPGSLGFGVWSISFSNYNEVKPAGASGSGRIYYRYRLNCMRNYENKPMKEKERYVPDPYSYASAGSNGHSIIIDPQWTINNIFSGWNNATDGIPGDIAGWFSVTTRPNTANYIVYELHIDDMTGSPTCLQSYSGSGDKCKIALQSYYTGNSTLMTAIGATSGDNLSGKYTGLEAMSSYLSSELGINAVHIMPLHEASNDNKDNPEGYGWGYLPSLFFAPESSYSSYCVRANASEKCTYDDNRAGYQVLELKRLIKKLHAQGIAVILDIVLNHTSNAFNYLYWIEPYGRYYFRTNGLNWSNIGTGNHLFDDRNQRPFAYKYILDNVKYWVKHYHVDGFRFDLAVGTSEATLRDIQNMLNDANVPASWTSTVPPSATETSMLIDTEYLTGGGTYNGSGGTTTDNFSNTIKLPNFLTGENWLGATRHTFMVQSDWTSPDFAGQRSGDYRGFSQWNDYYRESVKRFIQGLSDSMWTNRSKTAMYFSKSRDDGLWMAISKHPVDTLNYIESHDEETVARAVLDSKSKSAIGAVLLLTSHGIPMLYEGQEFMRNKQIQDQSKIGNNLNWQLQKNNEDFFGFMSFLVKLRKACPALRYANDPTNSCSNFDTTTPNQTISFFTKSGTGCISGTCSMSGFSSIDGKAEFRILANMTGTSQNFVVETGSANWRAVAAVTGGNDNTNCADQSSAMLRWANAPGSNNINSWGTTSSSWSLPCYSAVVLVKQ